MKVKCLYNTGKSLMAYTRRPLGTSEVTKYGQLGVGREYLVMGMILINGILNYLVDDGGVISACPYQLFEVTDNKISSNWHFKSFTKEDIIYPFREAVWGYYELCYIDNHFENILEMEENAHRIYYRRKIELEKEIEE